MTAHTLEHVLGAACSHDMKDITSCVICGKNLSPTRKHVDTCGETCFRTLLKRQREQYF